MRKHGTIRLPPREPLRPREVFVFGGTLFAFIFGPWVILAAFAFGVYKAVGWLS